MGKRHGLLLIATLGLALSFSGCGGGDTTGIFSGAPPPPSGIQQLFFADNATGATRGTLYAVESSIPTQPTIFTDNVNQRSVTMAYSGRFDAASQTVSGVAPYALVYERGGTLYRVDGNLSARQISQVGIADNLSSLGLRQNVMDPENSWIIFKNGNNPKAVRLGAGSAVPPTAIPGTDVLCDIEDGGGSISGWLIRDNNVVKYCGVNFSPCSFVKNVATNADLLGGFPSGDLLLRFDDQVFVFYPKRQQQQLPALSGVLYSFPGAGFSGWTSRESGNAVYFSDGGNILKVENSGYGTIPILTNVVDDATADVRVSLIEPTDGANVVYLRKSTTGDAATIFSVPKSGGPGSPLVIEDADGIGGFVEEVNVAGNRVYYNLYDASGAPSAVNVMSDNTNRVSIGDSYWTGATAADTFPLRMDKIFLVRMDPGVGLDNATVISYRASTFLESLTLGTLKPDPTESITDFHIRANFGSRVLGTATIGSQSDVYYLDADLPGSLKRVLKTPDLNETPVGDLTD